MEEDKTIRAFIAIELPAHIADSLKKIQDELRKEIADGVAWVKTENIHLTLKFFGDIKLDKIDDIERILKDAAGKSPGFDISVRGVGGFPTINNPRVIWVGIKEDDKSLSSLYNNLEDGLSSIGFEREERAFKPHLTIGRVKFLKNKGSLTEKLKKLEGTDIGKITVQSISIFKSKLTPSGAVYTKLKEAKLK